MQLKPAATRLDSRATTRPQTSGVGVCSKPGKATLRLEIPKFRHKEIADPQEILNDTPKLLIFTNCKDSLDM